MIALYWSPPGAAGAFAIIPSANLFHLANLTTVTGLTTTLDVRHTPRSPGTPVQGAVATYEAAALTLVWTAPLDTGCLPVLDYTVEATLAQDDSSWVALNQGLAGLTNRVAEPAVGGGGPFIKAGQAVSLRVVARNALGLGTPSGRVTLTPAALPSAPASIAVVYEADGSLTLSWPLPTDTGGGDQTSIAPSSLVYMLEVDEGFHDAAGAPDGFTALTSNDPTGMNLYSSLTFNHQNLLSGHKYTYRVKAMNLMGYGAYSPSFSFVPRVIPGAPPSPPRNVPTKTTMTALYVEFDQVLNDGGAAIT